MTAITTVKERPILFSGPMVRSILEGKKTQTRRTIKRPVPSDITGLKTTGNGLWQFHHDANNSGAGLLEIVNIKCPYGTVGDRLWVRETWFALPDGKYVYKADKPDGKLNIQCWGGWASWKPSIHMPREASRIILEITDIRVERLQGIKEEDAIAEGVERYKDVWKCYGNCSDHVRGYDVRTSATASFMSLWDSINAKTHPWDSNPWIWAVSFKRITD